MFSMKQINMKNPLFLIVSNISNIVKSSFDFYCKKEKKKFRFDESFYHSILWKKIQERDKSKFASAANTAILRKINWTL